MKCLLALIIFCAPAPVLHAQLTAEQKVIDFQQLAALFAKHYSFLEWKKQAVGFDGLDLRPWIERIRRSNDDIEYLEICAEYAASFQDGHTSFLLPSDFVASLPFDTDVYDGKVLIDWIDRGSLPEARFPFVVGDELIAINGVPVSEITRELGRFLPEGNPRTAQRVAAAFLTYRPQTYIPRAHLTGATASIVVRRRNGNSGTYDVPWTRSADPYPFIGPVPGPVTSKFRSSRRAEAVRDPLAQWPFYMRTARSAQIMRSRHFRASQGIGEVDPVFALPEGFEQRVGAGRFDDFFSGIVTIGTRKIGYLRLPTFEGYSQSTMEREIRYFEDNAAGLIVDVSRNPGGYVCEAEGFMRYFALRGIRTAGNSVRVTWEFIRLLTDDLADAKAFGGSAAEIAELELELSASKEAYAKSRGFTQPIPFCGVSLNLEPATDRSGNPLVFSKPLIVLVDDRSASAAELFAAVLQDSGRAKVFGYRTSGAGGVVGEYPAGAYSETSASLAWTILVRNVTIGGTEYPAAPYVENIGVRPDYLEDYMTTENLLNRGAPFVKKLFDTMIEYVNSRQQP